MYLASTKVAIDNGQGLAIHSVGSSKFQSPLKPEIALALQKLLYVPSMTRNLIFVSKFARDNNVFFEFHSLDCYVKSHENGQVLLEGSLGKDGLYCFSHMLHSKGPSCNGPSC